MNSKSRHFDGETQWNSNLFQRTFGGLYFQPNGATSKGVRVDQPQHCVRIGNRSGLTSPSVAGGTWLRTRACRAALNILEHVNMRYGSAPCTNFKQNIGNATCRERMCQSVKISGV